MQSSPFIDISNTASSILDSLRFKPTDPVCIHDDEGKLLWYSDRFFILSGLVRKDYPSQYYQNLITQINVNVGNSVKSFHCKLFNYFVDLHISTANIQRNGKFYTVSLINSTSIPTVYSQNQELLYAIWYGALDPMAVLDLDGNVLLLNPAFEETFGYSIDELLNQQYPASFQFNPKWLSNWTKQNQRGVLIHDLETTRYCKNNSPVPLLLSALPLKDVHEATKGLIVWYRPIKQEDQQNTSPAIEAPETTTAISLDDTEDADGKCIKSLANLANGIAHTLNKDIATVLGNTELLRHTMIDHPEIQSMLSEIATSAQNVNELSQQLSVFAGKRSRKPAKIEIDQLVNATLNHIHPDPNCPLNLTVHVSPGYYTVSGDYSQLSLAIANMYHFFQQRLPQNSQLTITLKSIKHVDHNILPDNQYVELHFNDNQPILSNNQLSQLFKHEFPDDFSTSSLYFATAYRIIINHNGYFYGRNSETNEFILAIPVLKDNRMEIPDTNDSNSTKTILFVEDDTIVAGPMIKLLKINGFEIIHAANGHEAIECARNHSSRIKTVLLDLQMPVMNGVEAFPHLQELLPEIPIILCSGFDVSNSAQRLIENGAAAFLKKPYSIQKLLEML